jgi:ubiquinone/menaquinone biosynthesis C-methylase UbiE
LSDDARVLKERYDEFATTLDYKTTACDFNLRELEIDLAAEYMADGMRTLDVGCGLGYAVVQYASRQRLEAHGIDYSAKMIEGAQQLLERNRPPLAGTVHFREASVLELAFGDGTFDVVTSSRCLMALLDWELQKKALRELARVLRPGGVLVLMEGTFEGLERLNRARDRFDLPAIAADGRDRLCTLKFHEEDLLNFLKPFFTLERIQRFGMYYLLTRIVHPLLVAPEPPKYDARINDVARKLARVFPDFEGLGHLVGFVLSRRG